MTVCPRHRMNMIENVREERVLIEGIQVDRTFMERLKQVRRDDFVSLKTAIEDQQRNSFFLLCYMFVLQIWRNRFPYSNRQKWKPLSKSTSGPS